MIKYALAIGILYSVLGQHRHVTQIDRINQLYPVGSLAAALGVPSEASHAEYSYINLGTLMEDNPHGAAMIWANPVAYFGRETAYGETKEEIQTNLINEFHAAGIKVLVSAFGMAEYPTSQGYDAGTTCTQMAYFVKDNHLDGIDISYHDDFALDASIGENWLIACTIAIRDVLPVEEYILTHTTQAGFFSGSPTYALGGYVTVNHQVGALISWFNVLYFNHGSSAYDSFDQLFIASTGGFPDTAVKNIADKGVAFNKIVIAKPATQCKEGSSGFVDPVKLGEWAAMAKEQLSWDAGIMVQDYTSDQDGNFIIAYKAAFEAAGQIPPPPPTDPNPPPPTDPNPPPPNPNPPTSGDGIIPLPAQKIVTYINRVPYWYGVDKISEGLGVPGYAPHTEYNIINLAFYLNHGPADVGQIWNNLGTYMGENNPLGSTTNQIQKSLRKLYHDGGITIMISAFGGTEHPASQGVDPVTHCTTIAEYVRDNHLDGVDLDFEDNQGMEAGIGEQWIIDCTRAVRAVLPVGQFYLSHAPQAPYFYGTSRYPSGGYTKVHQEVGDLIDFYNIQFYNQGNTQYNTYEQLFIQSSGVFDGTAVKNIMDKGVPKAKMVAGKPVTAADVANTGLVDPVDFGNWAGVAYHQLGGWDGSMMTWQFISDVNGDFAKKYKAAYQAAVNDPATVPNQPTNPPTTNPNPPTTNPNPPTTPPPTPPTSPPSGGIIPVPDEKFVSYINTINSWWPPTEIAKGMGVPTYATHTEYNVLNLAFALSQRNVDLGLIWENPAFYMGKDSGFGSTNGQIQANLRQLYHDGGITIMISAFGATEHPTTEGKDAVQTCTNLAQFVKDNHLDGLDLDWEDNAAMEAGTGEQWLIDCTIAARNVLPVGEYYLTHAPQAPYFVGTIKYPNGGYITIHQAVGHLIDWYNVQFYNQGDTKYDSYQELFYLSSGYFPNTAVKNIYELGVPLKKIVVGKPVTQADVMNSGLVSPSDLGTWAKQAKQEFGWDYGIMTWQFKSDVNGEFVTLYKANKNSP